MTDNNSTIPKIKPRSRCKSDEEYLDQFPTEVLEQALEILETMEAAKGAPRQTGS